MSETVNEESREDSPGTNNVDKVVEWLNDCNLTSDINIRLQLLSKVFEVVVHLDKNLLKQYLDEIIAFQNDKNANIKKLVLNFVDEAVKMDIELLSRLMATLRMLLQDNSPQVQKRAVQSITLIYRSVLIWLSQSPQITSTMQEIWNSLSNIKPFIINMIDNENDGLRTQIIKFLESIVLLQTYPDSDSLKRANDFSLDDIPLTLKIARRRKLEEEAITVFDLMLKFQASSHISSANLIASMMSLCTIAKLRPHYMFKVIFSFETLNMNLPSSLSMSQVNSIRKQLKMQLLSILKHTAAYDYHTNIVTLLNDLGASQSEINKSMPKQEDLKKRVKRPAPVEFDQISLTKKLRTDDISPIKLTAIDITEAFIVEKLNTELVVQMVTKFMMNLPDEMPAWFCATYTPISSAGKPGQIKHVARLLATQMTNAGIGPGLSALMTPKPTNQLIDLDKDEPMEIETDKTSDSIEKVGLSLPQRIIHLIDVAKPLTYESRLNLQLSAIERILAAENIAHIGGVSRVRHKLISSIGASFNVHVKETISKFVSNDIRNQIDLALSLLYEEYSLLQGFNKKPPGQLHETITSYTSYANLHSFLINTVIDNFDLKDRENLLIRLFLEAPILLDETLTLLKKLASEEKVGLQILKHLTVMRPPKQLTFLNMLLSKTSHHNHEIREAALSHIVSLYEREELKVVIDEWAILYLGFLKLPQPPEMLFEIEKGRNQLIGSGWTDDIIRSCLYLYMALIPQNPELIHELTKVYIHTMADVKRIILRSLELPVRTMGMDSPELLKLVEECPKGSETLVTRIIHILTDKNSPSEELVKRVRDLYNTRVSDVRFLIPVLNGLTKNEVISALPKLIKLNPVVVKEVFNRLLGSSSDDIHSSPITPSELLIALHTIDPLKCELKIIIKATSLCFSNKQAYTQEVLAVVMQNLMELTPLPTLLMRTVIQSLSLYPRLIGFIMNILQRLILKKVWEQKKVWEGFIKCCQRTIPHSFQVLLQLPPSQLQDVFVDCPELKQPLYDHIMDFTENQRAHIPDEIMIILTKSDFTAPLELRIKEEPMSPPRETDSSNNLTSSTLPINDEIEENNQPAPPGMD